MLQQTQVDRVIPKYNEFLRLFPTVKDLSQASLSDVLRIWSGLGYNRRARFLHNAAQEIQKVYNGVMPHTFTELQSLSGIGPYTASAVMVFAFNEPIPMIETNIRSVYIHEFFSRHDEVEDKEIMPYIEKTVDVKNPCIWYAALMDYGTYLKKVTKNPSRKSKHHVIQKAFKGSLREARGKILPLLFKNYSSSCKRDRNRKKANHRGIGRAHTRRFGRAKWKYLDVVYVVWIRHQLSQG
jgi:A/G-specific adenine glycosylase